MPKTIYDPNPHISILDDGQVNTPAALALMSRFCLLVGRAAEFVTSLHAAPSADGLRGGTERIDLPPPAVSPPGVGGEREVQRDSGEHAEHRRQGGFQAERM